MGQQKVKILAVAPYEGMRSEITQTAESFPDIQLDTIIGDLENGVEQVRQMEPDRYDAIISRGGTASRLREIAECPVIEVGISFYDILRSIQIVKKYSDRFAIIGFKNITEPAHILCDVLNDSIRIITIENVQDVEAALTALRLEAYNIVLGDMVTYTVSRGLGFDAFLITSGAESIRTALVEAESKSRVFSRNRKEKKILRTLLSSKDNSMFIIL